MSELIIAKKSTGQFDVNEPACMRLRRGNYVYKYGNFGQVGYMAGLVGTMKTTFSLHLAASAISGKEVLGFQTLLGGKSVLWIDGDQPVSTFERAMWKLRNLAEIEREDERLIAYNFSHINEVRGRKQELWRIMADKRNLIKLVVMDGVANFVRDANDRVECNELMNQIIGLAQHWNIIFLLLNHITAGRIVDNKLYGALGTVVEKLGDWGFRTEQQGKSFTLRETKSRYPPAPPLNVQYLNSQLIPEIYFPY